MTKLTARQIAGKIKSLKGWKHSADAIVKTFTFKDYHQTMAFVNAVAWIAHQTNHHPDLQVGYNKCAVTFTTHDAGGVTVADFNNAKRVEALGSLGK